MDDLSPRNRQTFTQASLKQGRRSDLQPASDMWDQLPKRRSSSWFGLILLGGLIGLVAAGGIYFLATQDNPQPSVTLSSAATGTSVAEMSLPASPTSRQSVTTSAPPVSSAPAATTADSLAAAPLGACTLNTLFADSANGFSIGQPSGWQIAYANGVIFVFQDADLKTAAFVYPIRLLSGSTLASVDSGFIASLDTLLKTDKGSLALESAGQLTGSMKGVPVAGSLANATVAGQQLLIGGWAPTSDWQNEQPRIISIDNCYAARSGTALTLQEKTGTDSIGSTTFDFALPPGWAATNLTSRGFDLIGDDQADIHYSYASNVLGDTTADDALTAALQSAGETNAKTISDMTLPAATDALGASWQLKAREFTATHAGKEVHGVVTVAIANADYGYGYGSYSSISVIREAAPDQWPTLAVLTGTLQQSVQIIDAQPGQKLVVSATVPSQSAVVLSASLHQTLENHLLAKRDEIINHYERLTSPSSGTHYLVPRMNYDATNPQGAGYYQPSSAGTAEKLVAGK